MNKKVFLLLIILITNCKESSVTPEIGAKIYQLDGCRPINKLFKMDLSDSCFSYNFSDKLTIDFCVSANCCPDKNRFLIRNKIIKDTITITITDTAANLCRCICNYIIHGEFESLQNDSYYIKCIRTDSGDEKLLYFRKIIRANKYKIFSF
ncbi:hypothetical protein [Rosettibacter firmus]|uniref:hypothetical protein n=1 Tax=Rosettibacter firmus TaxID=3111522 RepID=UPI00336C2E5F